MHFGLDFLALHITASDVRWFEMVGNWVKLSMDSVRLPLNFVGCCWLSPEYPPLNTRMFVAPTKWFSRMRSADEDVKQQSMNNKNE